MAVIFAITGWILIGVGALLDLFSLALFCKGEITRRRVPSGIPGFPVLLYFVGAEYNFGLLTVVMWIWMAGLVAFHATVHVLLPLAVRRLRPWEQVHASLDRSPEAPALCEGSSPDEKEGDR